MRQTDLFDSAEKSVSARDKALKSVADNSEPWFERAVAEAHRSLPPFLLSGEDVREYLEEIDHVGSPHHPNAWGALIARLVKDGTLVPTGRWIHMTKESSHARRTPEYRVQR